MKGTVVKIDNTMTPFEIYVKFPGSDIVHVYQVCDEDSHLIFDIRKRDKDGKLINQTPM